MCGVIGYVGAKATPEFFFNGLKRLEYRGYDSAGIAMLNETGVYIERAEGKLSNLLVKLKNLPASAKVGIAHTRWATHGKPTEQNAHPHRSGNMILLHNGIIENYKVLKEFLIKQGYNFQSETDTEVAAHLLNYEYKKNTKEKNNVTRMQQSILALVSQLKGAFAFGILCTDTPETIFAVKFGSPLVLGLGQKENYIASGITALMEHTQSVVVMEDKEIAILSASSISLLDFDGNAIQRAPITIAWSTGMSEKNGYDHFMLKEIHEQPQAVAQTISGRIDRDERKINLQSYGISKLNLTNITRVQILACGSSYYASCLARYFIEKFTKIPVDVELSSEARYRTSTVNSHTLCVAVSQSGETIDTLQAIKFAKQNGAVTLAIVNVPGSTIAHSCDAESLTHAGPEIGVASTKTFSAQLSSLIILGLAIAQEQKTLSAEKISSYADELIKVPSLIEKTLALSPSISEIANKYETAHTLLFIGRGCQWPVAMEGALKLKELAYIHAEGFAAGELKHGPIALIDENLSVVCIAPHDEYYEKTLSNIEEIRARSGKILAVGSENDKELPNIATDFIPISQCSDLVLPFLTTTVMHLFSYWVAVKKGTDVDQPRNLAKSVTVE